MSDQTARHDLSFAIITSLLALINKGPQSCLTQKHLHVLQLTSLIISNTFYQTAIEHFKRLFFLRGRRAALTGRRLAVRDSGLS